MKLEADEHQQMLAWLSPLEFWTKQNTVFGRRQEGTCTWFLEDPMYKAWVDGDYATLWCPGIR